MIHVESLTYSYPPTVPGGAQTVALDRITFDVPAGQCVAITGANGCGKTTLCLSVAGLAPRLTGGRLGGQIVVDGRNVQAEKPGALADVIGLVMQDPTGQLFNPTIADEIAWGLGNLGVASSQMDGRIAAALGLVGLESLDWDRPPLALSGGEQKRLAIAAALALQPSVLILDEPAGGLAPLARREMVDALRRLRDDARLTILLTESDPDVIALLADEMIVLADGRIAERGTPREVYHSLKRAAHPGVTIPAAAAFAREIRAAGGPDIGEVLSVSEIIGQSIVTPALSTAQPPPAHQEEWKSDLAIELMGVSFAYDPAGPVLRGIDLRVARGEFVALTGDNGAGKTTLARLLIGLLKQTDGRVLVMGEDAASQSIGQLARYVGFAFQNPELQIFNPTVREEIAFGPRNLGWAETEVQTATNAALERFGLGAVADYPPATLSFSARRMVALASIAAMQTPILVWDEPTVGLDAAGRDRVGAWLAERHQQGATILLITHDMEMVAACARRVLVLEQGQIAADGTPMDVFRQRRVLAEAGLEAPFAVQLAEELGLPALAEALTAERAAEMWVAAACSRKEECTWRA